MYNKTIAIEAIQSFLIRQEESAVDRYWSPDYIQHSATGLNGTAALKEFVRSLAALPDYSYQMLRVIGDGDYVAFHGRYTGLTPQPVIVFDLFRLEDGKLAEHWDAIQEEVIYIFPWYSTADGPTEITDLDRTADNKALVKDFFETILFGLQFERLDQYFEGNHYIFHPGGIGEDVGRLKAQLARDGDRDGRMEYDRLHRLIGEGNFVLTQSEGVLGGHLVAYYDLFRLERGKIVEHWAVTQALQPRSPNSNSPF